MFLKKTIFEFDFIEKELNAEFGGGLTSGVGI